MAFPTKDVLGALNALRAAYQVYRNAHWQVRGDDYYGNHLLFQRLYEETEAQVDLLAEQIVGTWGSQALGEDGMADEVQWWVEEMSKAGSPLANSLEAAKASRHALAEAYAAMEATGQMTLGWDDLLMSLSREKDQHVYLLQQASAKAKTSFRKLKTKLLR